MGDMIGRERKAERTRRKSFVDLEPGDLLVLLEGCSSVISGITVAVDFLARGLPRGDSVVGVSILGVNGGVAILRKRKNNENFFSGWTEYLD